MTITPTPLLPVGGSTTSAPAGTGKGEQAGAAGFGALLAQLAAAPLTTGKAAVAPCSDAGAATTDAEGALLDAADGQEAEGTLAAPVGSPDTAAIPVVTTLVAVTPLPATTDAVGTKQSASLAESAVRGVLPTGVAGDVIPATAAGGQVPTAPVQAGGQPGAPAGSSVPETVATPAAQQPAAVVAESAAATTDSNLPAQPQTASQPGGATAAPATAVPPAQTTTAGTAVPVSAGASAPVLDQVTPVLSRMVSAGEGSHRMVLRLHPADLGEVQLTVTVRGESVDVTVAAGTEARELLAGGSHELRGLLDSIGRTAGQITFKDLPGVGQLQQSSMGGPASGQSDTGQQAASYGDLSGGRDGDAGGRSGSGRTGSGGIADRRPEPERPLGRSDTGGTTTTGSSDGAVDVRI